MKQNIQFRRIRLRARKEQGSALVELALVLPVMLLFLTSAATLVYVLNQYLELTNAVTIGAQLLSVSRGNTDNPCTAAIDAVYNAAPNLVEAKLNFTFTFTNDGTSTSYATSASTGTSQSQCDTAAEEKDPPIFLQGESVQLYATYPCYSPIGVFGAPPVPGGNNGQLPFSCTLGTEVTEIIQ